MRQDETEYAKFLQDAKHAFCEDNIDQSPQDVERIINENKSAMQQRIEANRQKELQDHELYIEQKYRLEHERKLFEQQREEFEQRKKQFEEQQNNLIDPDHAIRDAMQLKQLHDDLEKCGAPTQDLNMSTFETMDKSDREQVLTMYEKLVHEIKQTVKIANVEQAQQIIDSAHQEAAQQNTRVYKEVLKLTNPPKTYQHMQKAEPEQPEDDQQDNIRKFKHDQFDFDQYKQKMLEHEDHMQEKYLAEQQEWEHMQAQEPQTDQESWELVQEARQAEEEGGSDGSSDGSTDRPTENNTPALLVPKIQPIPEITPEIEEQLTPPLSGDVPDTPPEVPPIDPEDPPEDDYYDERSLLGNAANWIKISESKISGVEGYYCPVHVKQLKGTQYMPRFVRVFDENGDLRFDLNDPSKTIVLSQFILTHKSTILGVPPPDAEDQSELISVNQVDVPSKWVMLSGNDTFASWPFNRIPSNDHVIYSWSIFTVMFLPGGWQPTCGADNVYPWTDTTLLYSEQIDPHVTFETAQNEWTFEWGETHYTSLTHRLEALRIRNSEGLDEITDRVIYKNYPKSVDIPSHYAVFPHLSGQEKKFNITIGRPRVTHEGTRMNNWSDNPITFANDYDPAAKDKELYEEPYATRNDWNQTGWHQPHRDINNKRTLHVSRNYRDTYYPIDRTTMLSSWGVDHVDYSDVPSPWHIDLNIDKVPGKPAGHGTPTPIELTNMLLSGMNTGDIHLDIHSGLLKTLKFLPDQEMVTPFRYDDFRAALPASTDPWWSDPARDYTLSFDTDPGTGKKQATLVFTP